LTACRLASKPPHPLSPLNPRYGDLLAHWQLKAALRGGAALWGAGELLGAVDEMGATAQVRAAWGRVQRSARCLRGAASAPPRLMPCRGRAQQCGKPLQCCCWKGVPACLLPLLTSVAIQPLPSPPIILPKPSHTRVQRLSKLEREVEAYWVAEYFRQANG
jgi:hypothetical protein